MERLTPTQATPTNGANQARVHADGSIHCYCGAALNQIDETTYKCPEGNIYFRMELGDIFKDKFGNVYLQRKGDH